MKPNTPAHEPKIDLAPSLRALVTSEKLDGAKLSIMLLASDAGRIHVNDRHAIPIYDGSRQAVWQLATFTELFRGNQAPPADLKFYPPEYALHFYFIENHLLTVCRCLKIAPSDQELGDIYATLRRRPDAKSLGSLHDFLWQVTALWLGSSLISEAEFDAVFSQLHNSTRKFAIRPISRNYTDYLKTSLGKIG